MSVDLVGGDAAGQRGHPARALPASGRKPRSASSFGIGGSPLKGPFLSSLNDDSFSICERKVRREE